MEGRPTKLFDTDESILNDILTIQKERGQGNLNNSLPVVNVTIPQTVVINCPMKMASMMRYANQCLGCQHFQGVVQTAWSPDTEIPWHDKYAINCGKPLERKTRQVVIE